MKNTLNAMLSNALSLFQFGDYNAALKAYLSTLNYSRKFGKKKEKATALYGISGVYFRLGQHDHSYRNLVEALYIYAELEDEHTEATILADLGALLREMGRLEDSFERYKEAVKLFIEIEDKDEIYLCYEKIAEVYWVRHSNSEFKFCNASLWPNDYATQIVKRQHGFAIEGRARDFLRKLTGISSENNVNKDVVNNNNNKNPSIPEEIRFLAIGKDDNE